MKSSTKKRACKAGVASRGLVTGIVLATLLAAGGATLWFQDRSTDRREEQEQQANAQTEQIREKAEQENVEQVRQIVRTQKTQHPEPKLRATVRNTHAPRPPDARVTMTNRVPENALEKILGDSGMSYEERRREFAQHKQRPLPPEEHEQLTDFVLRTDPPEGIDQVEMDALKSTALHTIRRRDPTGSNATQLMQEIVSDPAQGTVMREFSLQHLTRHYEDVPEGQRSDIRRTLWTVAEEAPEDELAATALLGLEAIQEMGEMEDDETNRLAQLSLERLAEDRPQTKVVALQTLAELKDPAGIEPAVALLQGETRHTSTAVRLAAIYLLGQVAIESHADTLTHLSTDGDKYEQQAALAALQTL